MKFLVFDTETTGFNANDRLVQIAWQLYEDNRLINEKCYIVKPYKFKIPVSATRIHGITTDYAMETGLPLPYVLRQFLKDLRLADYLIGHNIEYDIKVVGKEFSRLKITSPIYHKPRICTMKKSVNYLKIPAPGLYTKYKYPKLSELYKFLFKKDLTGAHNAKNDVQATAKCFFELVKRGIIKLKPPKNGRL